ncbi:hypothetical protein [Bacillus mycoides]|uniref:hypothetical protein n=1 Tax=Bacillus mycoides TaxID=1405 RepID=UPI00273C1439|nr:hypothetical protein [Bacillus mycoides]
MKKFTLLFIMLMIIGVQVGFSQDHAEEKKELADTIFRFWCKNFKIIENPLSNLEILIEVL